MARVKVAEPISTTSPARGSAPSLELYVIYTELEGAKAALQTASQLARDLDARLVLLVAKVVPFPLPLEAPPVSKTFTDGVLSQLAAAQEADVTVRVYLCRDPDAAIRDALGPRSLVVIGRHKQWWPGRTSLARTLKRDGHEVILVGIPRIQHARTGSVNIGSNL